MMDERIFTRLIFAGIAAIYLGFALPLAPLGIDDLRMANVFSIDESDIGIEVWNLYQAGWLRPPAFKYGGVFYYLPLGVLHVLGLFAPVTEQVTLGVLRLLCVLSGLGCLAMTCALGRLLFDHRAGLAATLLLAASPTFLRWSVETHPDLPQLFFLLCALFFGCRTARRFALKDAALSGLFAGLAFGTKYAGIFLLPILVLAPFLDVDVRQIGQKMREKRRWLGAGMACGAFLLAFGVTNPFAVIYLPGFIESLKAEKEIMAFGHHLQDARDPAQWLYGLANLVGSVHCAVVVGVGVWALARRRIAVRPEHLAQVGWIALFLVYLMLESQLKRARHLLPILPGMLILAGAAYGAIWDAIRKRLGWRAWRGAVLAGVTLLSWGHWRDSAAFFIDRWTRADNREEIAVGRWLADRFGEETSILFDAYAYVPGRFQNVYRSTGMTYQVVNHFEPDLLVVRDAIVSDFADLADAEKARMGAEAFADRHYFYTFLQAGRLADYRLLQDFGRVAVYERTAPRVRSEGAPRARWRDLVRKERDLRRFGQVEALWTMGYLLLADGLAADAEGMFARAQRMSKFTPRVYKHGLRLLAEGDRAAARHAFEAAMAAARSESIAYQAGMREDLAFRYFQAGLFDEAAEAAREGLGLADNLPVAAFELAVSRLAVGDGAGRALFEDAVARFGAHPKGLRLLEMLIHMNRAEEAAKDLMRRHYGPQE